MPGHVYLVTFTTINRMPVFLGPALAMRACKALTDHRAWTQSELLAWVLMPDHWHGLLRLGEGDTLPRLVGRLKANSGREARNPAIPGHVWARAFHDRAMRTGESLESVARYIVMNPVRARLVASPAAYPFWGAVWDGLWAWEGQSWIAADAAPTNCRVDRRAVTP